MQLNKVQAVVRTRNPWEAIDLGILLARRHSTVLMLTWALMTLPVFALLSLIFWQQPTIAVLVIWWLKPLFERVPLYILSNALFANTPRLIDCIKMAPKLFRPQLFASLTWRRLSLTRSFDLPVQQLEGLSGSARQQRLVTLGRHYSRVPTWLTIIGLHIEMAILLGFITLLYLLIPAQLQTDWNWLKLLEISQHEWLWAEHLSNLLYVLVLIIWEPIYVACGFTLYLNRRTELEAWDIELVFRQLAQRFSKIAPLLLLALVCWLPYQESALANAATPSTTAVTSEELTSDQPRLLKQMLNSEQAQQSIQSILNTAPFKNSKTVNSWHFPKSDTTKSGDKKTLGMPDWLRSLINQVSLGLQFILWGLLLLISAVIVWRYRQWLQTFSGLIRGKKTSTEPPLQTVFGLDISSDALPDDLLDSAQQLWPEQPRAALSLLYRGVLNHLATVETIPLNQASTEGEVLLLIDALAPELQQHCQQITQHWQNLAWGHHLLSQEQFNALCAQWQQLNGKGRRT